MLVLYTKFRLFYQLVPKSKINALTSFLSVSKLKTMPIAGIIRQFSLPKKVRFSLSHVKSLKDVGQFGIRLPLEPIDLLRLQQEVYLNGNAVNFGEF